MTLMPSECATRYLIATLLFSAGAARAQTPAVADAGVSRTLRRPWQVVRALAASTVRVTDYVDPLRGVTIIRYIEAPPTEGGHPQIDARHLCGTDLVTTPSALVTVLGDAIRQAHAMGSQECTATECVVPGMEFAPTYHVMFTRGTDDVPRIVSVRILSEAAMGGRWLTRMRRYVTAQQAIADAARCRAGSP